LDAFLAVDAKDFVATLALEELYGDLLAYHASQVIEEVVSKFSCCHRALLLSIPFLRDATSSLFLRLFFINS